VIAAKHVVKVHAPGTPLEVRALNDVSLAIEAGSFAAVIGESGSGKTTLLTLLGALDTPTSGAVTVNGTHLATKSRRELAAFRARSVGFVFQGFDLIPSLTALENVALPGRYAGRPSEEALARALSLLADVGLQHRSRHLPGQLSGGEQQRVAIARALANDPLVVLADEPTGELDSKTAEHIMTLLERFNRERGVTMVIVTHNRDHARRCSPVIVLQDGSVVA
jgi:putative ABC transport system ATP-binding protein